MKELNFKVDKEKCIHCGLCINDCIASVLEFNKDKIPETLAPNRCIGCQHCLSVCPVGAISIFNKNPDESVQPMEINPEIILNLIQTRRSIRKYKKENVDKETMQKLKNMLNWVPTGCNFHGLHFSFIDDIRVMNEFRDYVNKKIIDGLVKNPVKLIGDKFSHYTKAFLRGDDVIFRGAPHLLVVSNSLKAPCAKEDAIIALSYFELYAQSLGIGTCWCGFGQMCMMLFPELSEYLEIPEEYKSEYVMLFGPKDITYKRAVQPEKYNIISAGKKEFSDLPFIKKIKRFFRNLIK